MGLTIADRDPISQLMARDPNEIEKYEAALAALEVAEWMDPADDADRDKATAALRRMIRRRKEAGLSAVVTASPRVEPVKTPEPVKLKLDGLSVSEAAVAMLQHKGTPLGAIQIVRDLAAHGFEMAADNKEASLAMALRRRSDNYQDVYNIGRGLWALRSTLTEKQISSAQQRARTVRGMEQAKARGVRMGQPSVLSDEVRAEFERRVSAGEKLKSIAKVTGIAESTYRKYYLGPQLKALRAQGKAKDAAEVVRPDFRSGRS